MTEHTDGRSSTSTELDPDDSTLNQARILGIRYLQEMSEEGLGMAVMMLRMIAEDDGVDLDDVEPDGLHDKLEGYFE